ncbi:hypothetical protein BgiBS90_005583, partial [Biomphalaria glabrata]
DSNDSLLVSIEDLHLPCAVRIEVFKYWHYRNQIHLSSSLFSYDKESSPKESALPTTYVFLETLQTLFDGLQCGTQCLQLNHNAKHKSEFAVLLQVFCATCSQVKSQTYTSPKVDKIFTINRQVVAASLATGMGSARLSKFSELMNMPVMHSKSFAHHTTEIHKASTL